MNPWHLAADVFICVGDLAPMFEGASRVLERGLFCFTVEALADDDVDFQRLPSLRCAHSKACLLRLAAADGFEPVTVASAPVRHDQRAAIDGRYVCLRRAGQRAGP